MSTGDWEDVFLGQLSRLVATSEVYASFETPDELAGRMLRMLMEDGESTVDETRSRFAGTDDPREPVLSLIQLYAGAVRALCEQDRSREQEGLSSIFGSAPLTSRWLLLEVVNACRAVLLLSSRALDAQAVVALRQAWELAAKSIVLAADPSTGERFDRLSTVGASPEERVALDQELREKLSPYRTFGRVAQIERDVYANSPEPVSRRQAQQRFEDTYDGLSNLAHGGSLLAGVSEWSDFFRVDSLPDGISGPAEGESAYHFASLCRDVLFLLTYLVSVYPTVAFPGTEGGTVRRFFDDWLDVQCAVSEYETEYRLYLAFHVLDQLGPEYNGLVFGVDA